MVRRPSTGEILQSGKNELISSRNATHEGLKETYFSLYFLLASLVGFASLQKNAVVLILKTGEVKLFSINVTLRDRHSLFIQMYNMLWNSVHAEYRKGSCLYTIFHTYFHWFSWNEHEIMISSKSLKYVHSLLCTCSSVPEISLVVPGSWWPQSHTWQPDELLISKLGKKLA